MRIYTYIKQIFFYGVIGLLFTAPLYAGAPLWTFLPLTNTTLTIPANGSATIQYQVTNQSKKTHTLAMTPISGITQLTTPGNCLNPFTLGYQQSCTLTLEVSGAALRGNVIGGPEVCLQGNKLQCYQPSIANSLNIARGALLAMLNVNPTTLLFAENSTGSVTVTNSAGSPVAAGNVVATVPFGSLISVQSTTCGASLAIGASCTITFTSSAQEGPTTIPVSGSNTNTVNINVTVTNQPVISITAPVQQSRVVPVSGLALSLEITNDAGSMVNANAITVSNKTGCPNLSVDDANCASVAPGASCTLELTSSTPYAPCTITVSGSNAANSALTLIAFSHLGGLVFEESGGNGKVVIDALGGFNSKWTSTSSDITGAESLDNGVANTDAIIADGTCIDNPDECAAQSCRDIGADWYLPARNELQSVAVVLCPGGMICIFGEFLSNQYWSSSQREDDVPDGAWLIDFPSSFVNGGNKVFVQPVRCVRAFTA